MIRGLYTAASGALSTLQAVDVVVNNIANLSTPGFKKDIPLQESFSKILNRKIARQEEINKIRNTFTDFSEGKLISTKDKFDFAIEGDGFFVISTPQGIAYTRAGNFTLDKTGMLTTLEGFPVMGERGIITIPRKSKNQVKITSKGKVIVEGRVINTILIESFSNLSSLQKIGNNLFQPSGRTAINRVKEISLKQEYLEISNVDPLQEMVNLITNFRTYEINQKVIQFQDDTLEKVCNEIGRIR